MGEVVWYDVVHISSSVGILEADPVIQREEEMVGDGKSRVGEAR